MTPQKNTFIKPTSCFSARVTIIQLESYIPTEQDTIKQDTINSVPKAPLAVSKLKKSQKQFFALVQSALTL